VRGLSSESEDNVSKFARRNASTQPPAEAEQQAAEAEQGSAEPEQLPFAELRRRYLEHTADRGSLVEEPVDTGLWPTSGLSDRQVEQLAEALAGLNLR
jgi:hypothetical protein